MAAQSSSASGRVCKQCGSWFIPVPCQKRWDKFTTCCQGCKPLTTPSAIMESITKVEATPTTSPEESEIWKIVQVLTQECSGLPMYKRQDAEQAAEQAVRWAARNEHVFNRLSALCHSPCAAPWQKSDQKSVFFSPLKVNQEEPQAHPLQDTIPAKVRLDAKAYAKYQGEIPPRPLLAEDQRKSPPVISDAVVIANYRTPRARSV